MYILAEGGITPLASNNNTTKATEGSQEFSNLLRDSMASQLAGATELAKKIKGKDRRLSALALASLALPKESQSFTLLALLLNNEDPQATEILLTDEDNS
jgi:hypothetical protein